MAILGFDTQPLRDGVTNALNALRQVGQQTDQQGDGHVYANPVQSSGPISTASNTLLAYGQQGAPDPAWDVLGQVARQGGGGLNFSLFDHSGQASGSDDPFAGPWAMRNQVLGKIAATPALGSGAGAGATAAGGVGASGGQYGNFEQYRQWIQQYATANGIDPDALAAILQIETGGDPHATSPVGARGLGQIMPQTWAGLADPGDDPYNPEHSIKNAAKYYAGLYKQFGDYGLAAAAYQGGPGAIVNGRARSDVNDGNMTPEQYAAQWGRNYQGIKSSAPKGNANATGAIAKAQSLTGLRYTNLGIRQTGNPQDGVDCSSLVGWAYGLDRGLWNAQTLADTQQRISADQLQPGDLVYFQGTNPDDQSARPVSHVGIYMGNGQMINAQNNGVQVANLSDDYWAKHLYGYGRVTR